MLELISGGTAGRGGCAADGELAAVTGTPGAIG
jgi:hypothetical protein